MEPPPDYQVQWRILYRQKGAAAAFSVEGMAQCKANIKYYQENAKIIAEGLAKKNIRYFGGVNSPYIWFECPNNMESWDF